MTDRTAGTPDDETALPVVAMRRPRWGDPQRVTEVPAAAVALVGSADTDPGLPPDEVRPPESTISATAVADLAGIVGDEHLSTADGERVQHTRGYSTSDLLRLRRGDAGDAPDLVVYPAGHDEVVQILEICSRHRLAVVPFTGGTSVVGGLAPVRSGYGGVVCVDLRRLDRVVEVDEVSRVATLQAGLRSTAAEAQLRERGWTLGHFPQSYAGAGIGGYAATRSAGQSSAGYGRFDEMVEGLVLATPRGTLDVGLAPRSAAGPDLRQLVLGSEGVLGIITAVRVRIRPVPAVRVFEGWRFADFDEGTTALRRLAQDGPLPTVLRLSDETETALNLADPDQLGGDAFGCLVIAGYEGSAEDVERRREAASTVLSGAGGTALGAEPGEAWRSGRFAAPYLRDPLLDAGILVETLETVTYWSRLHELRAAVVDALTESLTATGRPPLVMCHISHVYAAGASLYFTVVAPLSEKPDELSAEPDESGAAGPESDPVSAWAAAKTAANTAIRRCGASITHHHAVGRDHRDAYHEEIGALALDALRAVKGTLDPEGVCNPGILL